MEKGPVFRDRAKLWAMNDQEKSARSKIRKLIVFGTAHELQGKNFKSHIDDQCYRDMIELLISMVGLDFVFEEAAGLAPTDAEIIAKERLGLTSYMDVDPPVDKRYQLGLSERTGGAYIVDPSQVPPCAGQEENVAAHEARENYWLGRIRQQPFTFALMICGAAHGLSFSFRLRSTGFEVQKCISYTPHDKLCRHIKELQVPPV